MLACDRCPEATVTVTPCSLSERFSIRRPLRWGSNADRNRAMLKAHLRAACDLLVVVCRQLRFYHLLAVSRSYPK
jgi:hypothetical protein